MYSGPDTAGELRDIHGPCGPGKYDAGPVQGCVACGPGFYQTGAGMVSLSNCTQCGSGAYQSGFGSTSADDCAECPPGSFQTSPAATACVLCGIGMYQTGTGAATANCSECSRGTFASSRGSSSCSACDVGSYANKSGAAACAPCSLGTFATASGRSVCFKCPAGAFAAPHAVAINPSAAAARNASASVSLATCGNGGNDTCWSCRGVLLCPGSSWRLSASGCPSALCPNVSAAKNTSAIGAVAGNQSARNQSAGLLPYANSSMNCSSNGSVSGVDRLDANISAGQCLVGCLECSPGTYLALDGAVSSAACIRCSPGTYTPLSGQTVCADCPAGAYSTGLGLTTCVTCTTGSYSNATRMLSARTCLFCPAGSAAPFAGASACGLCSAGTFQTGVGRTSCALCRGGKYATAIASATEKACIACPAGKFSLSGASRRARCYCLPQYAPADPANPDLDSQECVPSPTCGDVPACGSGQVCAPPAGGGPLRCTANGSLPPPCAGPLPSTCPAAGGDPVWVSPPPAASSMLSSAGTLLKVVALFPESVSVPAQQVGSWWQVLCPPANRFRFLPVPVVVAAGGSPLCSFHVAYDPPPARIVPAALPLEGGLVALNLTGWHALTSQIGLPCQASLAWFILN